MTKHQNKEYSQCSSAAIAYWCSENNAMAYDHPFIFVWWEPVVSKDETG